MKGTQHEIFELTNFQLASESARMESQQQKNIFNKQVLGEETKLKNLDKNYVLFADRTNSNQENSSFLFFVAVFLFIFVTLRTG